MEQTSISVNGSPANQTSPSYEPQDAGLMAKIKRVFSQFLAFFSQEDNNPGSLTHVSLIQPSQQSVVSENSSANTEFIRVLMFVTQLANVILGLLRR